MQSAPTMVNEMTNAAPPRAELADRSVLVVGDAMLDRYWFGDVERISPEAPVPVVRVHSTEERLGGAANVARNIVALGARAGLLTVVGDDDAGRSIGRLLSASGIDGHLHADPRLATTVKVRVIGRRQQITRVDFETAPEAEVLAAHLDEYESLLPASDVVLLSDYGKGGLTHIVRMIELARAAGRPVLVDPKGDDYSRYAGATLLTPNRAELREVIGRWRDEADLETRAQDLRRRLGLQAILLTRSEEGMTLFTDGPAWSIPAQAREVFDVSGAGDTVIAVLAVMIAAGRPLHAAVAAANRAGGIVVGKLGTATVSYAELFEDSPAS
jgi:rfaE bifunctional protein kinase chain/domain